MPDDSVYAWVRRYEDTLRDLHAAEADNAQLRKDLERTARERDAAQQTAEARRKLLADVSAEVQDLRVRCGAAVGALRETDAYVGRLLKEIKELKGGGS